MSETAEQIRIYGTVQGVGFRPTVYRIAKTLGLRGEVSNDGQGVLIKVVGDRSTINQFIEKIHSERPPLAHIETITRHPLENANFPEFIIAASTNNTICTQIAPDAATCANCKSEIFDPLSRWYRYPFTNCTHCGPRLSIIKKLPYDRKNTTMADFNLCSECQEDYSDPLNRRFHAQPTACHVCGPKAWLERADGKPVSADMFSMLDDVDAVCTLIQRGMIVAIKGLGGFHLACDATNEEAVQKLRLRKRRPDKPLALMARDIDVISEYCSISATEQKLLESVAAPIVLLEKTIAQQLAPSVAPGQNILGFMLPYTPLHHLALRRLNVPIVLTSGNFSDEPQCIDNEETREKLSEIADYFLIHNRPIFNRVDDSVVRVIKEVPQVLRRARGYAPAPINLPPGFADIPPILAMGSELKNTFCLLRDGQAILSQHIGDLENSLAATAYEKTLNLFLGLLEAEPSIIVVDKHPEYLSTKLGKDLAAANDLKIIEVQHHHSHVAACMAENGLDIDCQPVLGIALDGLGYGEDGTIWGGEFLLADYRRFERLGTFKPVAMIGGEQAIYQPWRNTYAHLVAAFGLDFLKDYEDLELFNFFQTKPLATLNQMLEKGINSPVASSCGRLFDAVAAAIGICRESCSYEGQAAINLEALATEYLLNDAEEIEGYQFNMLNLHTDSKFPLTYLLSQPMWQSLLIDTKQSATPALMAAKFHQGLAIAISEMVAEFHQSCEFNKVALTGGVFQNKLLLAGVSDRLTKMGLEVLTHSQVPPNDGGLSLGQVAIAAAKLREKEKGLRV
ncbi:carbamoyltransferase HypF [Dapis sp. BLCC M126]|uniref:carbamoyltransferase HypF n=1 Tax=Dapis sp. BLCC M126 TaxID=3400189 RepID=UPI003CEF6755